MAVSWISTARERLLKVRFQKLNIGESIQEIRTSRLAYLKRTYHLKILLAYRWWTPFRWLATRIPLWIKKTWGKRRRVKARFQVISDNSSKKRYLTTKVSETSTTFKWKTSRLPKEANPRVLLNKIPCLSLSQDRWQVKNRPPKEEPRICRWILVRKTETKNKLILMLLLEQQKRVIEDNSLAPGTWELQWGCQMQQNKENLQVIDRIREWAWICQEIMDIYSRADPNLVEVQLSYHQIQPHNFSRKERW